MGSSSIISFRRTSVNICLNLLSHLYFVLFEMVRPTVFNDIDEQQGCRSRCSLAAGLRGNEERMRKWTENEEMERE